MLALGRALTATKTTQPVVCGAGGLARVLLPFHHEQPSDGKVTDLFGSFNSIDKIKNNTV